MAVNRRMAVMPRWEWGELVAAAVVGGYSGVAVNRRIAVMPRWDWGGGGDGGGRRVQRGGDKH